MKKLIAKIILLSMILSLAVTPLTSFAEENLLLGAVITSNTKSADTSFLTDGTVEVSKGAECTQTRSNTYFLIDFTKEVEVNTIELYEFNSYKTKRLYGYEVETSQDGEKFKQIAELSEDTAVCSSDISQTLFEGKITFDTVKTRYLKLTVRKAMDVKDPEKTAVGYTAELKAYLDKNSASSKGSEDAPKTENRNLGVVITSNTKSADTTFLTDGIINVSKGAECTQARSNTYYLYDFGEEKEVNTIKLYEFNAYKTKRLYGYKIETSQDGEKFKQIKELADSDAVCSLDISENLFEGTITFDTVKTRYLKLTVRKAMDVKDPEKTAVGYVAEMEVYKDDVSLEAPIEEEDNSLYKIYVDGKKISFDVDPLMVNDRLLVPFRAICEALSMTVGWDDKEQKVTATKGANSIIMIIGNAQIGVNGVLKTSDVAPMLHNSRTVIPLRFLAEAIGCEVGWNGETNTVTIITK